MGRDNQPKHRQLHRKSAKETQSKSYPRILIVTEGRKTEPQYLEEIRTKYRLNSANIAVHHSNIGTSPMQGCPIKNILTVV
jgi:hypothetical protein